MSALQSVGSFALPAASLPRSSARSPATCTLCSTTSTCISHSHTTLFLPAHSCRVMPLLAEFLTPARCSSTRCNWCASITAACDTHSSLLSLTIPNFQAYDFHPHEHVRPFPYRHPFIPPPPALPPIGWRDLIAHYGALLPTQMNLTTDTYHAYTQNEVTIELTCSSFTIRRWCWQSVENP